MARQSTTPLAFMRSTRPDEAVTMTSGRAGVVTPVAFIPLFPGDSCSGQIGIDIKLAEMPKPLLNAVHANFQAWFMPKSAHPAFAGRDELMAAFTGHPIKALGQADRPAPAYLTLIQGGAKTTALNSTMFKTLGLHVGASSFLNSDLIDAFVHVYNFRLAAHSSKLPKRKYAAEDIAEATSLPPAFWPSSRFSHVVADYERALVVGSLDLDVVAGRLPVSGIGIPAANTSGAAIASVKDTTGVVSGGYAKAKTAGDSNANNYVHLRMDADTNLPAVFAEMAGREMSVSLAEIDKARQVQAYAKFRASLAGGDISGFDNEDAVMAMLMQGLAVPDDQFKRPWLLDSARVVVGMAERHATDAANLDQSVTVGGAGVSLRLNVPQQDVGGVIIVTCEVLPERVDERMSDEWLIASSRDDYPDALRDSQRIEPVDIVRNRRLDAKHTTPGGGYGFEPMNYKWRRSFTRLGGDFYLATPGGGWTENRSNIWQTEIINPSFTSTHFLAPVPFPHDVFADTEASAFELVARHSVAIVGLTQIGDPLSEANDDYEAVQEAGQ